MERTSYHVPRAETFGTEIGACSRERIRTAIFPYTAYTGWNFEGFLQLRDGWTQKGESKILKDNMQIELSWREVQAAISR